MKNLLYLLLLIGATGCSHQVFKPGWVNQQAPEHFTARFETSKGNFEIEATRQWSPKAVDRLYILLKHGFYNNLFFYRVIDSFVVQFGNNDTDVEKTLAKYKIPDEPVLKANERGAVSYARAGPQTRGNHLFINLVSNSPKLDTLAYNGVKGFPAFAIITKGMDVVDSLYNGYGEEPGNHLDSSLHMNSQKFLRVTYPKLDFIKKAYLVKGS